MQSQSDKEFTEQLLDELTFAKREVHEKPWGFEVLFTTRSFILKFINIREGYKTSLQVHEVKDEVTLPIIVGEGGGREEAHRIYYPHAEPEAFERRTTITDDLPLRTRPGFVHRTVGPITLMEVTTLENEDIIRIQDDFGR